MKSKLQFFLLIFINALLLLFLTLFNINKVDSNVLFTNQSPLEITSDSKIVLIRGAVRNEGTYRIPPTDNIAKLVNQADNMLDNANIDSIENNSDYIYIPYKDNSKLLINFATNQETANYLNISNDQVKRLLAKRPFLSIDEVKSTFNKMGITYNSGIIL